MPEGFEEYWKVVRPHRHREPAKEAGTSSSQPELKEVGIPTYADIERQVQATVEEMLARGIQIDPGFADRLRSELEWEVEESFRSSPRESEPVPSNIVPGVQLHGSRADLARELRRLQEVATVGSRMGLTTPALARLGELEPYVQDPSHHIPPIRRIGATEVQLHRDNVERIQDLALQRHNEADRALEVIRHSMTESDPPQPTPILPRRSEVRHPVEIQQMGPGAAPTYGVEASTRVNMADAISSTWARLENWSRLDADIEEVRANQPENPSYYERMGRQSQILLQIANLFNDLGVQCIVLNHSGQNPTTELQFRIYADTQEGPTSIGGELPSDGSVRLRLGYRAQIS